MSERPKAIEGNGGHLPDLLGDTATQSDIVRAINGLAVELQLIRQAVAELGRAVGELETTVRKAFISK